MMTPRHPTGLVFYPLVYLASTVLVMPVTMVLFKISWDAVIEPFLFDYEGSLVSFNYLAYAIALLLFAVPVYGWVSLRLYSLDGISRLSLQDHLRHCAFLYALFVATLVVSTLSYWRDLAAGYTQPLGPGLNFILWITGCAILMNLLALLWRHSTSGERGDGF